MNKKALERACEEYTADEDYNGGYGHYLAEQVIKQKKNEELEKRAELEYQIEFLKKANRLNVDDIYSDREAKQELIRKYFNYTKLNGDGKEKKFLNYCSDAKIGLAFKNIYYSSLNKINKERLKCQ